MSAVPPTIADSAAAVVRDCWNRIGVWGDSSCAELDGVAHCRNCPVYASAARQLLDIEPPADYRGSETEHSAMDRRLSQPEVRPHVVFRLGSRWFTLPAGAVAEVAERRFIHSFPRSRSPVVLGLANIRGSLVLCVSLARALELGEENGPRSTAREAYPRLLVVNADGGPLAWPADEVHGMHFLRAQDAQPATAAAALPAGLCAGAVPWRGALASSLDAQAVLVLLQSHLA